MHWLLRQPKHFGGFDYSDLFLLTIFQVRCVRPVVFVFVLGFGGLFPMGVTRVRDDGSVLKIDRLSLLSLSHAHVPPPQPTLQLIFGTHANGFINLVMNLLIYSRFWYVRKPQPLLPPSLSPDSPTTPPPLPTHTQVDGPPPLAAPLSAGPDQVPVHPGAGLPPPQPPPHGPPRRRRGACVF